jgi:hypothetical protein
MDLNLLFIVLSQQEKWHLSQLLEIHPKGSLARIGYASINSNQTMIFLEKLKDILVLVEEKGVLFHQQYVTIS